ncbi:hypothetical protein EDB85DRAFT_2146325 [Lactarius pseudohatsudake]|nr:hypothetical protein EDB85DRAFT_2146325 [Lactarius pseudohatsudake]
MTSFLLNSITVLLCAVLLLPEAAHALWPQPRNPHTGSDALRFGPSIAIQVALGRLVISRDADSFPAVRRAKALSGLTLRLGSTSGAPRTIATEATLPLGSRDDDYGAGGWVGNNPGGNSWCEPFKTWQNAYTFDPLSGPENLDSIVWPRAAASAEAFWSGAGGNVSAALPRLHELGYRFRNRGVQTIALQPEWCALRPFACDLTA